MRGVKMLNPTRTLPIGEDWLHELKVRDEITGLTVTTLTDLSMRVEDAAGGVVSGTTTAMPHVADGLYRGTIPGSSTASLKALSDYYVVYTAGSGKIRRRVKRTADDHGEF